MRQGEKRVRTKHNIFGTCGLAGGLALAFASGHALAIDAPPNAAMFFPNFGKHEAIKAPALDAPAALSPEAQRLMNRYPGARPMTWRGEVLGFYGTPMTKGATPADAAASFIAQHARAYGAGDLNLNPTWNGSLRDGRHHVFHYTQLMDGLPVEFGRFSVVVRTTPENPWGDLHNRVVQTKARLAKRPAEGFKPDVVTAATASDIAKSLESYRDLTSWKAPKQVIYFGEGDFEAWITPIRAWKVQGEIPGTPRTFSFFIDCSTGEIVHIRGEASFADVTGTVQANVTPGSGSDNPANPPVLRSLDDIFVTSGAASALTDVAGAYTLSLAGAGPVNVTTTVGGGQWAEVFSPQEPTTPILSETVSALLPGSASFVLNSTPSEFSTAQANGFYYQTLTHNYLRALTPVTWTAIDFMLPVNVNLTEASGITSCNAFYNGVSTNFFINTGGCNNTAGGSVASHEYGHHIVNQLGLAQGAFGEGFGDTMSMMIFDDPIIGRNFTTGGGVVRTPDTANIQYPCSGTGVHFCGQILGGSLWEIRKAYGSFYGSAPGLALVRQQHADWAMITGGGVGTASAHPQTAIDWLLIDDTNADPDDGSPNYSRLASAFGQHSIPVPPLVAIDIDLPDGLPESVRPGQSAAIRVIIENVSATANASTAKLFYRNGSSGAFTESPMTLVSGNEFRAIVPTSVCGNVEYYFSVQSTLGATITSPANAPTTVYALTARTVLPNDFETDAPGWTVTGTATTGAWVRGDPNASDAQPEDDHSPAGTNCWFTGQGPVGGAVGTADVDGGQTTLTSPQFDLAGATDAQFRFWLWYNNFAGAGPNADVFTTQVSSDNGSTWFNADVVGPDTQTNFNGWALRSFNLLNVPGLTVTNQVRIRFIADDSGSGSIVEAAIDDLTFEPAICNLCLADLDDGSGAGTPDAGVDINDLLYFLAKFELGDAAADLDNDGETSQALPDGGVDINDLLFFLARFESGC